MTLQEMNAKYGTPTATPSSGGGASSAPSEPVDSWAKNLGYDPSSYVGLTSSSSSSEAPSSSSSDNTQSPGILDQTVGLINKGYQAYTQLPGIKQLGEAGNFLGKIPGEVAGGAVAALGTPLINAVRGRPLFQNEMANIKENAQETGTDTGQVGQQFAQAAPLSALGEVSGAIGDVASTANNILGASQAYQGSQDVYHGVKNKDLEQITQGGLELGSGTGLANDLVEKGMNLPSNISETAANAKDNTSTALQNKALESSKNTWERPGILPKGYGDARDILTTAKENGQDIPQTLMDNHLFPSDHVTNGVFDTADSANRLRQQTTQTSHDLLRPSLKAADVNVEPTPVKEIIQEAKDNVNQNSKITPETKTALNDKLNTTQGILESKYPNGMKLSEMHDEKITYGSNVKRSAIGDPAANMEAQKNEALRDTLQHQVEQKAPPEIPVHEFNQALMKQYKAADYLDELNSKKVPTSLLGKASNLTGKALGSVIGSHIAGVPGALGGFASGGMVEDFLSNLPGKVRDSFLRNLQTTNPEAFGKVSDFLNTEHPIQLGPASPPKAPEDTYSSVTSYLDPALDYTQKQAEQERDLQARKPGPANVDPDIAKQDAKYRLQQARNEQARIELQQIIEQRKPPAPPPVQRASRTPKV